MGGSVGNRRHGRKRAPMAEINVTPFVDVMLVLLIIFMVAAPLLATGVPVDLPQTRAAPLEQTAEPVQVSLDRAGAIFVDDQPVSEAALPQRLAAIASQPAPPEGRRIYLRADRSLDYGRVMRVMGELHRAGLNRVALVSTGEESAP